MRFAFVNRLIRLPASLPGPNRAQLPWLRVMEQKREEIADMAYLSRILWPRHATAIALRRSSRRAPPLAPP